MVFKENYLTGQQRLFIARFYLTGISFDTLMHLVQTYLFHTLGVPKFGLPTVLSALPVPSAKSYPKCVSVIRAN